MQVKSITQNPRQKTLFELMDQALKLSKSVKPNNVFLMGQTRSGKSTVFNWIVNNNLLIGKGQKRESVYEINKLNDNTQIFAQVKQCYKSVTLIPNCFALSQQLGLIDMPGTRDQRTQIQVMMVSFIYSVFLKQSKRAKFVLVMTYAGFTAPDSIKMVNLVSMFINLFKCKEMTNQQLQKLFSSVTLLITSVPVESEQIEQMKQNYRKKLRKLLNFMSELTKTAEIFPYIQMMVNTIIEKQRLEVFPRAKYEKIAQPCYFKQNISEPDWGTCQFEYMFQYLKVPYQEQFSQLKPEQQSSLKRYFDQKVYQFKSLKTLFSSLITVFLNAPIKNTYQFYQYEEIYQRLKQLYLQELIQDPQQKERQQQYFEQQSDQQNLTHGPVTILQNIFKLYEICLSFEDAHQSTTDKYKQMKQVFQQSCDWITDCFALTRKSKSVILKIKQHMSSQLDYFRHISDFSGEFKAQYFYQLKQSVQFINQCPYMQFQIPVIFCKNTNLQDDISNDKMEIQHVDQLIAFLNKPQQRLLEKLQGLNIFWQISYKLYKLAAEKHKQQQSLDYHLQAFTFLVSLKLFYKVEAQYNIRESKDIIEDISYIDNKLQDILYEVSAQILEVNNTNFTQLQKIFSKLNVFCYIPKIYNKHLNSNIRNQPKDQFIFLQKYLKTCEQLQDYVTAIQIIKKLKNHSQVVKNKKSSQYIKKQRETQKELKKYHQKVTQKAGEKKLQNQVTAEKKNQYFTANLYVTMVQLIYLQILKETKAIKKQQQLRPLIEENLKSKRKEQQQRNQFTVELPLELTNYDILFYSKYLVSKINNRKTIILLGKKAGKTTVSYWLRGKQLVKYGNLIDIKNRQNSSQSKIKHKNSQHTEVPNIYQLNEEQLLVDAPYVYKDDPYKMLMLGHFLKEIILSSSQSKFLLVIKQSDILANQCISLVEMLQFYIKMFDSFKQQQILHETLSLLVTFIDNNTRSEVSRRIHKLIVQFSKQENEDFIQEKYKLNRDPRPCSRQEIVIALKYLFAQINFLDIQNEFYKKKHPMINQISSKDWVFHKIKQKIQVDSCIFNPILESNKSVRQQLSSKIVKLINPAKTILQKLRCILQKTYQHHDKSTFDQQCDQLANLISPKFIQDIEKLKKQAINIKTFKYSQIQIPHIQQKSLVSFLQLFLTYRINVANERYQHSYKTVDLKQLIKEIFRFYMQGVGAFFSNIDLLQTAWIKLWHILTELSVFQIQPKEIIQGYENQLSNCMDIRIALNLKKQIGDQQQYQLVLTLLTKLESQMLLYKEEQNFNLMYKIIQETLYFKRKHLFDTKAHSKLKSISQYFTQNCTNHPLSAIIIYQNSLDQINVSKSQKQDSQLKLTLKSNIQRLCQKLATFDPQSALLICDKYQNNRIKQKVLETMFKKEIMDRQHFQQYYKLLIQTENDVKANDLLISWKSKSKISEQQFFQKYARVKAIQKNESMVNRNSFKNNSLQELKQIFREIQPIFNKIRINADQSYLQLQQ